jgi:hypothetical protein
MENGLKYPLRVKNLKVDMDIQCLLLNLILF